MGLTLPEIMCSKYFTRRPLSFTLINNYLKRYYLHPFSENFTPKNETSDSHKLDSYEKNGVVESLGISEKFLHFSEFFDEKSHS